MFFNTIALFLLAEFLEAHEYPEHIKQLVQKERELEEQEKRQREIERNTCKVRISSNNTFVVRNVSVVNSRFFNIMQELFCDKYMCICNSLK